MNQKEIKDTVDRYNKRFKDFGVSEQALGWGTKGRAKLRYEILLSQWDFNGCSVLDFGCGFGDMFGYMCAKGMENITYTGIDINPNFISVAKDKYSVSGSNSAQFHLKNLLDDDTNPEYDYILSSGVFNYKLDDNMGFITRCFDRFNKIAQKGFSVNFLSSKVAFEYDYTYHANPAAIVDLAYRYSNNVVLRNDYMPFEFTIFVNKNAAIDEALTVYKPFVKYV